MLPQRVRRVPAYEKAPPKKRRLKLSEDDIQRIVHQANAIAAESPLFYGTTMDQAKSITSLFEKPDVVEYLTRKNLEMEVSQEGIGTRIGLRKRGE